MKHLICITILMLILPPLSHAHRNWPSFDHSLYFNNINLETGIHSDIHVRVFVNERNLWCLIGGESAVAVHGVAHTAASWQPFAEALFSERDQSNTLCRIYAIDLPGHGQSSLPRGIAFGDLLLENLVASVRGTLSRLAKFHVRPKTLYAHSQGGLLVQMLQQELIQSGHNLRARFNVKNVVLLSSSSGAPLDWAFGQSPTALETIGQLITTTPERGTHVVVPAPVWKALFMANFSGELHPAVPSDDTVEPYNSPESLFSLLSLVGAPPFARPTINPGLFAAGRGSRLLMVGYSQDAFGLVNEQETLYRHLTDDSSLARFGVLYDDLAVHDIHLVDPERVVSLLNTLD